MSTSNNRELLTAYQVSLRMCWSMQQTYREIAERGWQTVRRDERELVVWPPLTIAGEEPAPWPPDGPDDDPGGGEAQAAEEAA